MKKRTLVLFCALLCVLSACGTEGQDLRYVEKTLDLDLSGGTLERFEDDHGGFHGDGQTTAVVAVDGLAEELADTAGWKPLPMTDNAAQAVRLCEAEGETVEETAEGFYYLYDRQSQSSDPYDDTQIHSRASWNFTMAVYDSEQGRLYFYKFDT